MITITGEPNKDGRIITQWIDTPNGPMIGLQVREARFALIARTIGIHPSLPRIGFYDRKTWLEFVTLQIKYRSRWF